jgi:hypothetical protein
MLNFYDIKLDNGTAQLLLPMSLTEADRDRLHALIDIAIQSQNYPQTQASEYDRQWERTVARQIQQSIDEGRYD